ncbi:MAG: (2Fe-2S) ferredoxin domain-containing protein [Treponema sp.]
MKIELCQGSSCHVKGAKQILDMLRKAIKENNLTDKVEIAGTVCLGQCKSAGVNMRIDGNIVTGITTENFNNFFQTNVLDKVNK